MVMVIAPPLSENSLHSAPLQVGSGLTAWQFLRLPPEDPAFFTQLNDACLQRVAQSQAWGEGGCFSLRESISSLLLSRLCQYLCHRPRRHHHNR